jgi:hypothetical protein
VKRVGTEKLTIKAAEVVSSFICLFNALETLPLGHVSGIIDSNTLPSLYQLNFQCTENGRLTDHMFDKYFHSSSNRLTIHETVLREHRQNINNLYLPNPVNIPDQ